MTLPETPRYLLDVNVLVALLDEEHVHHKIVLEWLYAPGRQWAVCPFSEAGVLRHMVRPKIGGLRVEEVTTMIAWLEKQAGYHYQSISAGWQTLCVRFSKRLFGHNQITDAYLLGLAVHEGLVLVTFDKAIVHLAGEYGSNVLLLTA